LIIEALKKPQWVWGFWRVIGPYGLRDFRVQARGRQPLKKTFSSSSEDRYSPTGDVYT
jgi:hypothetical protein